MKTEKNLQTEILLQKLFSGDKSLSEQALMAVVPEDREGAKDLVALREDSGPLLNELIADLAKASGELRNNYPDQRTRRHAIKALGVTIDGVIFALKRLAVTSLPLTRVQMDQEEIDFLREQSSSPSAQKVRLPGFRDNLKRTFKLFAKAYGTSCSTDFGREGFRALCATIEVRHRLVHPKSFEKLQVQNEETKQAGVALAWIHAEIRQLLDDCHASLGKTVA
jgi:hypothetical protein